MVRQTQSLLGLRSLVMSTLNAAGRSKPRMAWPEVNFMATNVEAHWPCRT